MPSLHYGGEGNTWGAWAQQGVCGRRGGKVLCVTPGDLVWSHSTELGSWAYKPRGEIAGDRSEEHTSELQSRQYLVCRLLLEKKKPISYFYLKFHDSYKHKSASPLSY